MEILHKVFVGQQLTLKIGHSGIVEGDFAGKVVFVNKSKTCVHLGDVVYCQTGEKFNGVKRFYQSEILKVTSDETIDNRNDQSEQSSSETVLPDFELTLKEVEAVQNLISNYSTIETTGEGFESALDDIFHYQSIGLTIGGVEDGEKGEITFIVCSTPHKIYKFRISSIGVINGRLKELFESDDHTKVIHGTKGLVESLRNHGIQLKRIFDTMDVNSKFEDITLPSELTTEGHEDPLASISRTAILLKFHDFLMERLLADAYRLFQLNVDYCRSKPAIEVQKIYRSEKSIVDDLPILQIS